MKTCPRCNETKPFSEFYARKSRGGAPASRCKQCSTDAEREWRRKQVDYDKRRYEASKVETRERHLVRKYGMTLTDYSRMLESQGAVCAICAKPENEETHGVLHVDHCHATGDVRGLLCRNCNHVLGLMRDDPVLLRRASEYLVPQIPELIGHAILESIRSESEAA